MTALYSGNLVLPVALRFLRPFATISPEGPATGEHSIRQYWRRGTRGTFKQTSH